MVSSDPVQQLQCQFNYFIAEFLQAFVGIEGFKLLPSANKPPESISASPKSIDSILNPENIRKVSLSEQLPV